MPKRKEKLCSLKEAVKLIPDGARIAFGGFAVYQKPMAAVHEIIRAGKKELTIVGSVNSLDVDMLAGAGALKRVETSYVGLEAFGLAPNYRRAVQQGEIEVVHYSEMMAWDRFRANWDGLPYWPAYYLGGSDLARLNPEIIPYVCPVTGKDAWAVPPANPDVVILHAKAADKYGNVVIADRHLYPQSMDVTMSHAGGRLMITAEEIRDTESLKKQPHLTYIPSYKVQCVIHVPFGSHPTPTLLSTRMDREHFGVYAKAAQSPEAFQEYLDKYIRGTENFKEYLLLTGAREGELKEENA